MTQNDSNSNSASKNKLISLYEQMAELTWNDCQKRCRSMLKHKCCSNEHCELAQICVKKYWKIDLKPTGHEIPFMGESGCTVPPHLRPNCSVHHCDICSLGFHKEDQKWTKKYFKLRDKISELECKLFSQLL